jgi:hypothetical protein
MARKKLDVAPRKIFSLSLNKQLHYEIKKYCIEHEMKMYDFFEKAIDKYLKECKKDKGK